MSIKGSESLTDRGDRVLAHEQKQDARHLRHSSPPVWQHMAV